MPSKHRVLRDTREQQGWNFVPSSRCLGTVEATLTSGDYTLEGYEHLLTIERKATTAEWAKNVCKERFVRELERLEAYRWPFLICQFTYQDLLNFPKGSGIPPHLWRRLRLRPDFLIKKLDEWMLVYRTKFILAGEHAQRMAAGIFKRAVELCPTP